jgi:hypothetical protein
MTRARRIRIRRRIFFGCEGESEQAYGALLQDLVSRHLHLHIDAVIPLHGGGDPLSILERAVKVIKLKRNRTGTYAVHGVLLDHDRIGSCPARDQQLYQLAERNGIHLIWQKPSHEGFLLHHVAGYESLRPSSPREAMESLRKIWPDYRKNMTALELRSKIKLEDVLRACVTEPDLKGFLERLGFFDICVELGNSN